VFQIAVVANRNMIHQLDRCHIPWHNLWQTLSSLHYESDEPRIVMSRNHLSLIVYPIKVL
jgi:hypothetical protein